MAGTSAGSRIPATVQQAHGPSNEGLIAECAKAAFASMEAVHDSITALEARLAPAMVDAMPGPAAAFMEEGETDAPMHRTMKQLVNAMRLADVRLRATIDRVSL